MAIKPLSTAIGVTNKIGFEIVTTSGGDGYGVIVDVFGGKPAVPSSAPGVVPVAAAQPATVVTATVAASNGKIKIYKNVDDAMKDLVKFRILNQAGGVVSFVYDGIARMEAKPFSGDIVAKTKATIASYNAEKTGLVTDSTALAAKLLLLPKATTAELALWNEVNAQKATIDEQVTWLTTEVTRLTALLPK